MIQGSPEENTKNYAKSMLEYSWLEIASATTPEEWEKSSKILVPVKIPNKVLEKFKLLHDKGRSSLEIFSVLGIPDEVQNYSLNSLKADFLTFIVLEGISSILNRGEEIVKEYLSQNEEFLTTLFGGKEEGSDQE